MKLGPTKLICNKNRFLLRRKAYRSLFKSFYRSKINWDNNAFSSLKKNLRKNLRTEQKGRCIYCRRLILLERRNVYEDIEHFLDKSKAKYRQWAFTYLNLSLACRACNFEKNTKDLWLGNNFDHNRYPVGVGAFKWIHPYFDDYHANILIGKGWTYIVQESAPNPEQAARMITECKLNEIETIEKNSEIIKNVIYRLTLLTLKAIKANRLDRAIRLSNMSEKYQNEEWYNH